MIDEIRRVHQAFQQWLRNGVAGRMTRARKFLWRRTFYGREILWRRIQCAA